jgi:hypothetical protein
VEAAVADVIVEDYLTRLRAAVVVLPPDRGAELVQEISDHIAEARAAGQVPDEASLRTLLDRLGDPEEIAAAARDSEPELPGEGTSPAGGPGMPNPVNRPRGIAHEVAAVALMTVGSIVPVLGWGMGVLLLWTSRRWRTGEKLVATLVFPLGPFAVILLAGLAVIPTQSCATAPSTDPSGAPVQGPTTCTGFALPPWLGITLLVAWVILPFVIGGVLLKRAADRAATEPAS